ncbi:MAG: AEC family transporter [Bauldia litoralis]
MFSQLFSIIAPVIICAAIGYFWQRRGGAFDSRMVAGLVTNVGTPCLIVATLGRLTIDYSVFWQLAGLAIVALACFFVITAVVVRLAGLSFQTYAPSLAFANTGNLGLPLCLFAFGDVGLALAIAWFAVNSIAQFTIGMGISAGQFSLRQIARTPVIYAVAVALAFAVTETPIPKWLLNTVEVLGGFAIPLMLIALGVSLAGLKVSEFKRSIVLGALRLVMGFAVGVAIAEIAGLEGPARGVVIIEASMPAAVFNYLWAQYYQRDPAAVAGIVVASTLMAFIALPFIVTVAIDPSLMPWR